jgi:hypothetical protein
MVFKRLALEYGLIYENYTIYIQKEHIYGPKNNLAMRNSP